MNTIESRINDLIYARTEDIGKIIIKDKEHKDLESKAISIMNEIKKHLPEGKRHLINELEYSNNAQIGLIEFYMYKQGFKDGLKLNNFL